MGIRRQRGLGNLGRIIPQDSVGTRSKQTTATSQQQEGVSAKGAEEGLRVDLDFILEKAFSSSELKNKGSFGETEIKAELQNRIISPERIDLYEYDAATRARVSTEQYNNYVADRADISLFSSGGSKPWSGGSITKINSEAISSGILDIFANPVIAFVEDDDWYDLYFPQENINQISCTMNSSFFYDHITTAHFNTIKNERPIVSQRSRRFFKTYGEVRRNRFSSLDGFNSMSSYGYRSQNSLSKHYDGTWDYSANDYHPLNVYSGENFAVLLYVGQNAIQATNQKVNDSQPNLIESARLFNPNPLGNDINNQTANLNYFSPLPQVSTDNSKKIRAAISIDMSLWPDDSETGGSQERINFWKKLMDLDNTLRNKLINPINIAVGSGHVLVHYSNFSGGGISGFSLRAFGIPDLDDNGNEILGGRFGQLQVPNNIGVVSYIAAGGKTNCVIKNTNGRLFAWGDDTQKQCTEANSSGVGYDSVAVGSDVIIAIRSSDKAIVCFGDKKEYYYKILGIGKNAPAKKIKICGTSIAVELDSSSGSYPDPSLPHLIFGKVINNAVYSSLEPVHNTNTYTQLFLHLKTKNQSSLKQEKPDQAEVILSNTLINDIRYDVISQLACGRDHFVIMNQRGEYFTFDILPIIPDFSRNRTDLSMNIIDNYQVIYGKEPTADLNSGEGDAIIEIKRRIFGKSDATNSNGGTNAFFPKYQSYYGLAGAGRNFTAILTNELQPNRKYGSLQHNILFSGQDSSNQCSTSLPNTVNTPRFFKTLSCFGLNTFGADTLNYIWLFGNQPPRSFDSSIRTYHNPFPTDDATTDEDFKERAFKPFQSQDIFLISSSRDSHSKFIPSLTQDVPLDIGSHLALAENGKLSVWGIPCSFGESPSDSVLMNYEKSTFGATAFSTGFVRLFGKNLESTISSQSRNYEIFGSPQFYRWTWQTNYPEWENAVTTSYVPPFEKAQKIVFSQKGYYLLDLYGIVRWYPNNTDDLQGIHAIPTCSGLYCNPVAESVQYDISTGKQHVISYDDDGRIAMWGNIENIVDIPLYPKQIGNMIHVYCGDYCNIAIGERIVRDPQTGEGTMDAAFIWGHSGNDFAAIQDCDTGDNCYTQTNTNCCDYFYNIDPVYLYQLDTNPYGGFQYFRYGTEYSNVYAFDSTDTPYDPPVESVFELSTELPTYRDG